MPIQFVCSECDRSLKADESKAGKKVRCPECGSSISIPESTVDREVETTFLASEMPEKVTHLEYQFHDLPVRSGKPSRRKYSNSQAIVWSATGVLLLALFGLLLMSSAEDEADQDPEFVRSSSSQTREDSFPSVSEPNETVRQEQQQPSGVGTEETKPVVETTDETQAPVETNFADFPPVEDGLSLLPASRTEYHIGIVASFLMLATDTTKNRTSRGFQPMIMMLQEPLSILRFSPDDHWIAFMSGQNTIQVVERFSLPETVSLQPIGSSVLNHDAPILDAVFHPNGKTLVTASGVNQGTGGTSRGVVRFWDAESGTESGDAIEFPFRARTLAFHPEGKLLAVSCANPRMLPEWRDRATFKRADAIYLIDPESHEQVGELLQQTGEPHVLRFSPDGKLLLSATMLDGEVHLWDVETQQSFGEPIVHTAGISDALFLPDGNTLITGCSDGNIYIRETATGEILATCRDAVPEASQMVTGGHSRTLLALSPLGNRLASARYRGGKVRLWDIPSGNSGGTPIEHGNIVTVLCVSPNGKLMFVGDQSGMAQFRSMESGNAIGPPLEISSPVYSATFSNDGKVLVTSSQSDIQVWNVPGMDR